MANPVCKIIILKMLRLSDALLEVPNLERGNNEQDLPKSTTSVATAGEPRGARNFFAHILGGEKLLAKCR